MLVFVADMWWTAVRFLLFATGFTLYSAQFVRDAILSNLSQRTVGADRCVPFPASVLDLLNCAQGSAFPLLDAFHRSSANSHVFRCIDDFRREIPPIS